MTRRELIEQALQSHGIDDAARMESHVRGCDLSRPVSSATLDPGSRFQMWVRIGGAPGKYAAPIGEDPARLGIMMEGRECYIFEVKHPLTVVRCTAAWFPTGLVERVGGNGGGTQYILPPDWLASVERIS